MNVRRIAAVAGVVAIGSGAYFLLQPRIPDGPLVSRLSWLVDRAASESDFTGFVLVARQGAVEVAHSGAETVGQPALTPDSRFPIASLSKAFTAVALLQLVEAQQLAVTDTLSKFFPALDGTSAADVTVHQLLTHTSGLDEVISRDSSRRITPDDLRTAVITPTTFEYSNTGYVALALVIERVTETGYANVITDRIFFPAGMTRSGHLRQGEVVDDLARGDGSVVAPSGWDFNVEAVQGAGSIYSTASDLLRFDRALSSGALLSVATLELMTAPHVPGEYGYGWMLSEQGGHPFTWHSGNLPGFGAYMARIPARDEFVVVLSNRTDADVRGLGRQLLRQLRPPD